MSTYRALLAAAFVVAVPASTASCDGDPVELARAQSLSLAVTPWHEGNFRYLPAPRSGDIAAFVASLEHPDDVSYVPLSPTRGGYFNAFVTALLAAIDASVQNGDNGDWCGVMAAADRAGYAVERFYDNGIDPATNSPRDRWFVYGYDKTTAGQAYFFINPGAKRDIVIEVPHASTSEVAETHTDKQGVNMLVGLAARALLLNKAHRCTAPVASVCGGQSAVCNEKYEGPDNVYRSSDVAHTLDNSFHILHTRYSSRSTQTRFVQLHGMQSDDGEIMLASDGSTVKGSSRSNSVSGLFVDALMARVGSALGGNARASSCQRDGLEGFPDLCATHNVQGRTTNRSSSALTCQSATETSSNRFLHLEQKLNLRTADLTNRWVEQAVRTVWPACNMTSNALDCALGPPQSRPIGPVCPVIAPP